MKRCLITERLCPMKYDICCTECAEDCASRCTSNDNLACNAFVEMPTEMIRFESKYLQALHMLVNNEKQLKMLKEQQEIMKENLLDAMKKFNVKKFENEFVALTLVDEHVQQKFDSKAFQLQHPDVYSQYITASEVKASVRVKVK